MTDANEALAIKDIITAASPLIKSLVDAFVTPKLENFKRRFNIDRKKYYIPMEDHFSEYFHRTYKRLSVINTLVFNNSQQLLKDIYIPLTLIKDREREKEFRYKIDEYPQDLINEYEKILVTDTAGMGKSTLMKRLFLDVIDKKHGIPILVELRRLSKGKTIIKEIQEQLNSIAKEFESDLLSELIMEGGFIFILDGYDEISLSDREIVTADIQNFIAKSTGNKFMLTSRPESALSSFGDFQEFKIAPLNKKEAYELLRKYDKQGTVSTLLTKKLDETDMQSVEEFLSNPLLVSLLFTAFQHKQAIPFKKYLFYRQVYDANFESHDLTKGDSYTHDKYSKLEIDDFHRVLRYIGYSCMKNQKIEFTKDEILALISNGKSFCVGLKFNESDFFKDLLITVPLFAQDGNYYKWAHKSLQEYFAAQFIYLDAKEQQSKILLRIYLNDDLEKFINILDLYYDMDYKTFRNVIIYELLKEYKEYNDVYLKGIKSNVSDEDLTLRKEMCFLNTPYVFKVDSKEEFPNIDNKIDKMLNKHIGKINLKNLEGIIFKDDQFNGIMCLFINNPKNGIINLLSRKKNSLVKRIPFDRDNTPLQINYPFGKLYELKEINGDIYDELNLKINFTDLNKFLYTYRISPITIFSEEAFASLNEIEENIKMENSSDFY